MTEFPSPRYKGRNISLYMYVRCWVTLSRFIRCLLCAVFSCRTYLLVGCITVLPPSGASKRWWRDLGCASFAPGCIISRLAPYSIQLWHPVVSILVHNSPEHRAYLQKQGSPAPANPKERGDVELCLEGTTKQGRALPQLEL